MPSDTNEVVKLFLDSLTDLSVAQLVLVQHYLLQESARRMYS